jgi:phage gpG-like protein
VSWDDAQLRAWAERISALAQTPTRASELAATALAEVVEGEFATGTDPYGREWRALAPSTLAAGRHPPPLTDTGAMRESVSIEAVGGGLIVGSIAHPAQPHQTGWDGPQGSGPARPLIPTGSLSPSWANAIREAAAQAVAEASR